jgi:Zn-dependent peptidase ImmA (M78 family)
MGASPDVSATWGSFEIWVKGVNLCQHREQDETLDAVHWYLLPLLTWIVTNWDALLHEERLPSNVGSGDAWNSFYTSFDPPYGVTEEQVDQWHERREAWWQRHALQSCREGGLFPDLLIRRMQNTIEFSWGPTRPCGAPSYYEFVASPGFRRIEPKTVVKHLSSVVRAALTYLATECPQGVFQTLSQQFDALSDASRSIHRMGYLAGIVHSRIADAIEHAKANLGNSPAALANWLSPPDVDSRMVVSDAPPLCLMFGSASPELVQRDVEEMLKLVSEVCTSDTADAALRPFVRNEPIRSSLELPWRQGYRLAESFREELSLGYAMPVDLERLFGSLGIAIREVALEDRFVRAVAIAGENLQPTVALNSNQYQSRFRRRFTLAHELCHLLYDRSHGVRLALTSGPWAPLDLEKRANAFAAMLLMPPDLITSTARSLNLDLDSAADIHQCCDKLEVSFSALIEHLHNLGLIDTETLVDLKQEMT